MPTNPEPEDPKKVGFTITNAHLAALITMVGVFSQGKDYANSWADERTMEATQKATVAELVKSDKQKTVAIEDLNSKINSLVKDLETAKGDIKAETGRAYEADIQSRKDIDFIKAKLEQPTIK